MANTTDLPALMVAASMTSVTIGSTDGEAASAWVARYLMGVEPGGVVADIACGRGRHARLALAHGYRVIAIDRDLTGVQDLAAHTEAQLIEADLEDGAPFPLADQKVDGAIVTNYLWRPIIPLIADAMTSRGVLIYETFALGHANLASRPRNPQFLLGPNELLDLLAPRLHVIAFEQAHLVGQRERIVQRIVAVGREHRWTLDPPGSMIA